MDHPREIAIIVARGVAVIAIYHVMVNNKQNNKETVFCAQHVHGIPMNITTGVLKWIAVRQARGILREPWITEIVVNGGDIAQMFPELVHKIRDINLRPWCVRPYHFSHHINRLFKVEQVGLPNRPQCTAHSHEAYIGAPKQPRTIGQRHKVIHGFHCALADAYELMAMNLSAERSKDVEILIKETENKLRALGNGQTDAPKGGLDIKPLP